MKSLAALALAAGALVACAPSPTPPEISVKAPRLLAPRGEAPPISFLGAGGETVTLERFAGSVVVLNLWASWCSPCVREMPSLDMLAHDRPDIAVVAVSLGADGLEEAEAFLRRQGLAYLEAYHDPDGQLLRRLGARGLPTTLVIDPAGRIVAIVEGAVDWAMPNMRELLGHAGQMEG